MDKILDKLIRKTSAKGSIVVTQDGMVVAGRVQKGIRKDVVGALSSFLIAATDRCMKQGKMGKLSKMTMVATHGKLIIVALSGYFLVVLTDQFIDMGSIMFAIQEAVDDLGRAAQIEV